MNHSTQKTWKKALSVLLVFALLLPMIPAPVFAATASETEYLGLVARMENASDALSTISATYGEVDFGNGYTVDLKTELDTAVANIDHDLGVAAAIVGGNYKDPRLEAAGVNNSNTKTGYNQSNFDKAFPDKYTAATTYLEQGGIAVQKGSSLYLTYFFSYKSKLNAGYTASAGLLGPSEGGKDNIVILVENYVKGNDDLNKTIQELQEEITELQAYKAEADQLQSYFLTLPCSEAGCDNVGTIECTDWTHRLLVPEGTERTAAAAKFTAAVEKFKADIDRDIKIVGALSTGNIDKEPLLQLANKNGSAYYNNTAAKTSLEKINAAISFLEKGGYNEGSYENYLNLYLELKNQIAYKSNFSNYNVEFSSILGSGFKITGNDSTIEDLVEGTLNILRAGTTADNLDMVYKLKTDEMKGYIDRAIALRNTDVPVDGTYTQAQFEAAIEDFVTKGQKDLSVAAFLANGNLDKDSASRWIEVIGNPLNVYQGKSQSERQANALRFFSEGGFGWNSVSLSLTASIEYKSAFYPEYSSGLFGMLANKGNIVTIMSGTIEDLEAGNKYMTPKERAKLRYEQSLAHLKALKENPSAIVDELLKNDTELKQIITDLNTVIGSMDSIIQALDTLQSMGVGADILNPILEPLGLSYENLAQLKELKKILNDLKIDTSGNGSIEESMKPIIGNLVGWAVDAAILTANATALLGTENAYNGAADILDGANDTLMNNAAEGIKTALGPVMSIIEPIRPYLDMLNASVRLMNHVITLADQVNGLTQDFTAGKLSAATNTMAYSLDDMADLLEAFDRSGLGGDLSKLLENSNVGGTVADQTAGFLNQLINQLIQQDVGISGSDLGFLKDTVNSLLKDGLNKPTALVPLLRTSADILRRAAVLEGGIQDVIDGNYESAWNALTNDFGSIFRHTATLWNELVALFETQGVSILALDPQTGEGVSTLALDPQTGEMSLAAVNGDEFLTSFGQGINDEAAEVFTVLKDPSASHSEKMAKINEFTNFLKDIYKFVAALEDMSRSVKSACTWADHNLTQQQARAFTAQLAHHYVERMRGCVESGWNSGSLKNIISEMKGAADEIRDILCFIKSTGDLKIIATEGEGDVFYTFSTNYDELRTKLAPVLENLGIRTGYTVYTVGSDVNLFRIGGDDENALLAAGDLETKTYQVGVAYKLFFDVCGHGVVCELATKQVTVQIGEGPVDPEPVLTRIAVTSPPTTSTYTEGDTLDLTGLVVTGYYDDQSEQDIPLADCTFSPAPGAALDTVGTITVAVSFGGFETTFTVTVNENGGEEKQDVTVTFNANGGALAADAVNPITVREGTAISLPGVVAWANHTFNGWYDGETKVGIAGESYTVNRNVTLTAHWTDNTGGGGGGGGGGSSLVQIQDEAIPLGGIFSLMSLNAEPKNGIVYYTDGGKTIFVPFCFVIGDKIYFFGQAGIEYHVKANPKQFKDVNGHWAYDNIMAITEREAFQGYPDNSFQPNSSMTRAMLAAVLARMAMVDTSAYTTRIFDDVAPDAWYGPSVAWAFEQGIVTGMGNNKFNPNANVTRQEISVMLSRFVDYMQIRMKTVNSAPFADQDQASSWAKAAITDMQKYDIVGGKANNRFDPYADSTRAEIATMLYRLIQASVTYEKENNADSVKKTN